MSTPTTPGLSLPSKAPKSGMPAKRMEQRPHAQEARELDDTVPAPLSPTPEAAFLYSKDTLAYEHDRAAHKKTLDRARNKARKAQAFKLKFGWGGLPTVGGRGRVEGQGDEVSRVTKRKVVVGDEDRELAADANYYLGRVGWGGQERKTKVELDLGSSAFWNSGGRRFTEVRLADLVVLASEGVKGNRRKGRLGKGGLDGEFEVVPHMRSVIVLDEQQFASGGIDLLGDAWECVEDESGEDSEEAKERKSYAKVAAAAMGLEK